MSIPPGTDTEKSSMGGGRVRLLNGIAQFGQFVSSPPLGEQIS